MMTKFGFRISSITLLIMLIIGQLSYGAQYSLNDCVGIAIKNNPQMKAAIEKVNISSAKMAQAGSSLMPKISLDAGTGKNYSASPPITLPAILGGGTISLSPNEPADVTNYSLTFTQALFAGGKILQGLAIARAGYDASQHDYRKTKDEITLNVISSFYGIQKASKFLDIVDESKNNLQRNLGQTKVFYDAGITSYSDVLRIETQIANLELSRIQAKNGIKLAKLVLETVVGEKINDVSMLKEEPFSDCRTLDISQEAVLDLAYKNRADWQSYTLAIKIAEDAVGLAYSGYLPNIAYTYSAGKTKTDYPKAGTNYDLDNWRSMVVASWPIFDGLNTQGKIKEAYATLNQAKAQGQSIKDGIAFEVNSTYYNLQSAIESVAASAVAADLAERALRSVEISYKTNIASEQQYLDTQAANHSAKINLWSSKYDLEIAKAKLNKVVGIKII